MARLIVTYLTWFCLCFCINFAASAKVSIHDKAFEWAKVDLGARLKDDPISKATAEQAVTALLYAPGAATEFNAIAICEKGVFGLQNQVQLKLKAEREAATDETDAAARLGAVRLQYMEDLATCIQEAAQHANVRDHLNAALASAKASNIDVDRIGSLEKQKKALEEMVTSLSNGTVSLKDAGDSGSVEEVIGSGNSTVEEPVSENSGGKPDGNNAMLERIADDIRSIDTLIAALKEGGNSTSSDSFKNALASLTKARSEQIAASPTPATTQLIATTAIRNTHLVSPAEMKRNQHKPVRLATGANREKPRKAAAGPKEDTVLELLNDLSTKDSNTRRLLEAEPDSETALSDTGAATKPTDVATAQLLSDAVESKAGDSDKAAAKWGHRHHWHHSHHNHHWHHSHWPHLHHNHHSHHRHAPQIGSSATRAKTAAFMASSSYKDEGWISGQLGGQGYSMVKFYSGNTGVQRFIARSGSTAVVAFRGSESGSDWAANLQAWPCPWGPGWVHCGFLGQFQDQQADLDAQLDSLTRNGVNDILITGHSLGGALSWLATYYIKNRYPSVNVEVISFAAPSNGNDDFMNWIYARVPNHNHVVYEYDLVPCVPPGYPEPSQMRHYTSEWQVVSWGWQTWYDSRMHSCWTCLAVWDHSMSNYCNAVGAGSSGCPAAF